MFKKRNKSITAAVKNNDVDADSSSIELELRKIKYLRHFPNIEHEQILKRYSCALVGDFLRQGNLYVTGNYIAFHSNIFGYVTKLLIPLCGIESITKEKTAKILPNAIGITTPEAKYIFSSLISRDKAFNYATKIWQEAKSDVPISDFDYSDSGSSAGTSEEEVIVSTSIKQTLPQDEHKHSINRFKHSKIYYFTYYTAIILIVYLFISSVILVQRIFKIHNKYSEGDHSKMLQTEEKSLGSISDFLDDKLSLVSTVIDSLEKFNSLLDENHEVSDKPDKYFSQQKG